MLFVKLDKNSVERELKQYAAWQPKFEEKGDKNERL